MVPFMPYVVHKKNNNNFLLYSIAMNNEDIDSPCVYSLLCNFTVSFLENIFCCNFSLFSSFFHNLTHKKMIVLSM